MSQHTPPRKEKSVSVEDAKKLLAVTHASGGQALQRTAKLLLDDSSNIVGIMFDEGSGSGTGNA